METADSQPPFLKLQLLAIFASEAIVGIGDSFLGPSLDDLKSKYKVDTQHISLLFPVCIGAQLLGCFVFKHMQKYRGDYLLMSVSSLVAGFLIAILAVLSSFWIAFVVIAVIGFLIGILQGAGNVKAGQFAKDSILPYNLISFGYTTGTTTGPLLLYSFVHHRIRNHSDSVTVLDSYSNGSFSVITTDSNGTCTDSQIGYGFLIITGVYTVVGIGMMVLYIILKNVHVKTTERIQREHSYWQKGLVTFVFIATSLFLGFIGGTTNVAYVNLLPRFGIYSALHEDPQTMALLTSTFSAVTLFGRLCVMCLSYAVPQICLFFLSLVGVLFFSVLLFFIGEQSLTDLWVGSSMFALFYAPVYGTLLTWSEKIVPLSSTYLIIMTFLDNGGLSFVSLIIGQLMTDFNVNMLHLSMVFVGCIQLICFLVMFILSKYVPSIVIEYSKLDSVDE